MLTNSHVVTNAGEGERAVRGASRIYVVFADGDRIPGSIVGWDLFNDTGLVKVDPRDHAVSPVPLGDSSRVVVGEPVAAIGSPFGQESSLAVGVVSATERSIDSLTSAYDVSGAIQIDAPINHGNSGGPLLDARGRVIGINAQIRSDSGNAEGVGFAIPINSARRSMEQLISTGKVAYAYVGVTTQDVTPALARRFKLGAPRGALDPDGDRGRPGRAGGAARRDRRRGASTAISISLGGDLIVAFAGKPVERAADVARIVTDSLLPGDTVSVTVLRGGKGKRETVRLTSGRAAAESDALSAAWFSPRVPGHTLRVEVARVRQLSVERERGERERADRCYGGRCRREQDGPADDPGEAGVHHAVPARPLRPLAASARSPTRRSPT